MAELSQLHKEWETSRQDLKQYEAVEAGTFAAIEHVFPTQSKQICDKDGCFPMEMSHLEAWELIKAGALADSKIDGEAINIRKRIGKLSPTTAGKPYRQRSKSRSHEARPMAAQKGRPGAKKARGLP